MRIVLLGDHILILRGLARLFESIVQAAVHLVLQPGEIDALVREHHPDLIVINVPMAIDVATILAAVRPAAGDVPILVMGPGQPEIFLAALRGGARGFMTPDSTIEHLQGCLRAVVQGEWGLPRAMLGTLVGAYVDALDSSTMPAVMEVNERERAILQLLAHGHTTKQIAQQLNVSDGTVQGDVRALERALGVENRTQLIAKSLRTGLLSPGEQGRVVER